MDSRRNAAERWARASPVSTSAMARVSTAALFRNLARAGTLKNRFRTVTVVPRWRAQSSAPMIRPAETRTRVPTPPASAVSRVSRDTDAMDGSASPRNPKVRTPRRSSSVAILLVACRSSARSASSRPIPWPSSETRISVLPPLRITTSTRVAAASRAFSTSSFTTEAGRSTTSPAAIWFASVSGRIWIRRAIQSSP